MRIRISVRGRVGRSVRPVLLSKEENRGYNHRCYNEWWRGSRILWTPRSLFLCFTHFCHYFFLRRWTINGHHNDLWHSYKNFSEPSSIKSKQRCRLNVFPTSTSFDANNDDTISIASEDEDSGDKITLWMHIYVPDCPMPRLKKMTDSTKQSVRSYTVELKSPAGYIKWDYIVTS